MKQNAPRQTNRPTALDAAQAGVEETAARLARRPWPATPIRPDINVSFEFFPPASPEGETTLARCAAQLAPLSPRFVSVTYGAGGTTQDRTASAVRRLATETDLAVAGHLTCVGATRDQVAVVVDNYIATGVRHIVALRGDAPAGLDDGSVPGGYRDAAELVAGIRRHLDGTPAADLEISVGCYPEVHPKAESPRADLDNLKRKLDAGADRAISQFFFDTDVFLRFLDRARAAGITAPIVPGIMPITSFSNICRFSERCGTEIPEWMHDLFAGLDDAPDVHQLVAATVAAEQCRRLAEHGVNQFHFYTMNRPELTLATCRILGVRPDSNAAAVAPAAEAQAS
ncbi:MAG TPA: methylenetetrahydrofolate reductase [NAD(P)H] [Acidimicrobiia bacterium]|nr:methylenetetrahydrofolate reductase [NAD(P)H] [Acidimicrobiia bacterium]